MLEVCGVVSYPTSLTIFWGGRVGAVVGVEWGRVLRVGVWILFFHFVVLDFGAWIWDLGSV